MSPTSARSSLSLAGAVAIAIATVIALLVTPASLPAAIDVPLPLGTAVRATPTERCDGGECFALEVTCSQVAEPALVTLKIHQGDNDSKRGTILFMTGGGGTGLWERFGDDAQRTLRGLRRKGFRTVQLAWDQPWLNGAVGALEGQALLACRPATAARWIYDNLHADDAADVDTAAFCATGNSGGSAQISYMATHYGLTDVLDTLVPTGGPPMGRLDLGCLGFDLPPNKFFEEFSPGSANTIDRGFGFYDGGGPCATGDESFASNFLDASISTLPLESYFFADTRFRFLIGELDSGSAVGQGITFHDALVAAGTPRVDLEFVPRTPHAVPSSPAGARAIRRSLRRNCKP